MEGLQIEIMVALIAAVTSIITTLLLGFFSARKKATESERNAANTRKLNLETQELKHSLSEEKSRALRSYLEDFLRVLQMTFEGTERVQQRLIGDLADVEYHPLALKNYFAQLDPKDARRTTWFAQISYLVKRNAKVLRLLEENKQPFLTVGFRDVIREFKDHARDWEDMWRDFRYVTMNGADAAWDEDVGVMMAHMFPLPEGVSDLDTGLTRRAARFPKDMQAELSKEKEEVLARLERIEMM